MLSALPSLLPDLSSLYEDLHAHPELSFAEHRTAELLAARLRDLGYQVTTGVGRTGVVAVLANGPGPTVLLRADIDGLPVAEATGLPYASTVTVTDASGATVPVMHACGHDMHATWMIGAATLLATHRDWSGTVMIVLQPAEEVGSGADAMVDDGLFERFGLPDVALGQHLGPFPAGLVLHHAGPTMAAADTVRVVLHGTGGHASRPETTVDPVVMAAHVVTRLQTIVSREVAATDTAVVTVGMLRAGSKENIIPDRAELGLSVRTFSPAVRQRVLGAVDRIVAGEAETAGAPRPPEVSSTVAAPLLDNDAAGTATVAAAFVRHFGPQRVAELTPLAGSEDFGVFGTRGGFPSVFWFVGGGDPDAIAAAAAQGREVPSNHSPYFAPVQHPTIATGVETMVTAALAWLDPSGR